MYAPEVITIGLTGGIGSGKSSVGSLLVERGAELIDADVLARAVVEPGQRAWAAVRERFGSLVIAADGRVDRAALADIVFSDEVARADLNAIVHPEVARAMLERVGEIALLGGDQVVVLDVPLLVEAGGPDRYGVAGVLVVDAPLELCIERLARSRGMDRAESEQRIASQATREERLASADFVIMNIGSLEELDQMVDRAWHWICGLREASAL